MGELTRETSERTIIERDTGRVTVQTREVIKDGDRIVTELPWRERVIQPYDDIADDEADHVKAHVEAARAAATVTVQPPPQGDGQAAEIEAESEPGD